MHTLNTGASRAAIACLLALLFLSRPTAHAQLLNLALSGTASSSSQGYGAVASDGNDGNRNGDFGVGSVFHTLNEASQSSWQVQFQAPRYLDHIRIFNRVDAIQGSVSNFRIIARNGGTVVFNQIFLPANATDQNSSRAWGTSAVRGIVADQVRIERVSQTVPAVNFLTFAEFEVWGSISEPPPLIQPESVSASPSGFNTLASDANDGDINGNYNGPGLPIYHSLVQGAGQFWEMTLPTDYLLGTLLLFNRTDAPTTTNVRISIFDAAGGPAVWSQDVNISQGLVTPFAYGFVFSPNTAGRRIRIETLGNEFLAFSELQAFGSPVTVAPPVVDNLPATNVAASTATVRARVISTGFQAPSVKIYYGTSDGGTNPATWSAFKDLGPQSADASAPVTGLSQNTTYYFRAFAQNSGGSDWADSTASFTTESTVPATLTIVPASGRTGYTALLNGKVLTVGNDPPLVTLFWDFADKGPDPAGWNNHLDLGIHDGPFGGLANNLVPNQTYFFRAAATNAAGSTWSSAASFTTTSKPPVVFNEIHYKPEDRTKATDFIELFNPSSTAFDVSGWRIRGGVDYVFPAGTTFPAGAYRVIVANPAAFQSYYGFAPAGQWLGNLRNSGELLELRDSTNTKVDDVDFAPGFPWPTSAAGGGPSIELINPCLENDLGGSWRSSTHIPLPQTPGAPNSVSSTVAPPAIRHVAHSPGTPAAGQDVLVTAEISDANSVASAVLTYQIVNPGTYIRKLDPAYSSNWISLPMNDSGANGDAVAGDGIYSVTLPASIQLNRRLIRYRISATDSLGTGVTVPYPDDDQPNFAYFVYDGLPSWSGALQPGAAAPRGTIQTFPASTLAQFEPWHLIADANDVTNSQYNSGYNDARLPGTIVYDGKVYDHIQFKNRGKGSTYVSGKNKWGLYFNRARDIRVKDNWGNYYEPWNSVALDANASPWCSVHRGSAGVEEAASYRMFDLAGVPALRTNYVHWRVIDNALEAGPTQFDGDFWGLYLALEPMEGNYIDERGLPDGNVYDIEGGQGDKKHQGSSQSADASDWNSFRNSANAAGQTEDWYRANVDLAALYTFFAIGRFNGNVDIRAGDNLRFYHRSSDNRWVIAPYDLDMMFVCGHHWSANIDGVTYAGVTDQFRAITRHPNLATEFRNRARELLDLFASDSTPGGGQIGQLIAEYAQLVNPAGTSLTWAAADAAMWNMHPRTAGSGAANSNTGYSSHKNNFFRSPYFDFRGVSPVPTTNWTRTLPNTDASGYSNFEGLMTWFLNYATNTWPGGTWTRSNGDQRGYGFKYLEWESLYGGLGINPASPDLSFPNTPAITDISPANHPADSLQFSSSAFSPSPNGGSSFAAMQWRIGEIRGPGIAGYITGRPMKYEVQDVWTSSEISTFSSSIQVPLSAASPGSTYRARVRHKDSNGRWSHWSAPVQFTVTAPDVSVYEQSLVISELNYNPSPATQTEIASGFGSDDFEFIELKNVGASPVNLSGVRFTKGVDFDFPQDYTIPPHSFALVVKNLAAFQMRYGHEHDPIIAGSYGGDNLANSGEQLKLSYGAGTPIIDFTYANKSPWPISAAGDGYTLTLRGPDSIPDPALPVNWKSSYSIGGTPGADDFLTFESWSADYPAIGSILEDPDGDGFVNLLEYALASNPKQTTAIPTQVSSVESFAVDGLSSNYLTITYTRRTDASDLQFHVEFTNGLGTAWSENGVLVESIPGPGNTALEKWRAGVPVTTATRQFARVRIVRP